MSVNFFRTRIAIAIIIVLGAGKIVGTVSGAEPSVNLWHVSQGIAITDTSGLRPSSDARDMFGGAFSSVESGDTVFADGKPEGFIHYVEWQTKTPISLESFRLLAVGNGPLFNNEREFSTFTLKAKSSPTSSFDIILYSFAPTQPYTFADPVTSELLTTNITPTVAQFFRAEFAQYNGQRGFDGPRVIELAGYGPAECVQPPLGLIGWWPGDGNAADIVGRNNGATLGDITFGPGKVGQAFSFDGGVTGQD
jgi:hypothetical protein